MSRPKMTIREQEFHEFLVERFSGKPLPNQFVLAEKFGVHQTRISQLLARLIAKGYVTKPSQSRLVESGNGRRNK